jgi:hypothetical protein
MKKTIGRLPDGLFLFLSRRNEKRRSNGPPFYVAAVKESGEVEPIEVHHLVPGSHEVVHELHFSIVAAINFSNGTQF